MRSVQTIGRGFSGSTNKSISIANAEVLTTLEDTNGYYNFTLQVFNDCHISVNGSQYIFLGANTTFETDSNDTPIKSLKIQENGVEYIWVGAY
jgi:hypothetical protein